MCPERALVVVVQAKKVKGVQAAFKVYNIAMHAPGKGELTMVELRVRALCELLLTMPF